VLRKGQNAVMGEPNMTPEEEAAWVSMARLTYHSMSDRKIMDSDWRAVLQCPWHSDLKGR